MWLPGMRWEVGAACWGVWTGAASSLQPGSLALLQPSPSCELGFHSEDPGVPRGVPHSPEWWWMPGTWSCRWSRRLMVPGAGGSWPASRAHPEAPFLISWGLERTGGLEELWRLGARASVPWRLQAFLVTTAGRAGLWPWTEGGSLQGLM